MQISDLSGVCSILQKVGMSLKYSYLTIHNCRQQPSHHILALRISWELLFIC